jgi:hypothetical protein
VGRTPSAPTTTTAPQLLVQLPEGLQQGGGGMQHVLRNICGLGAAQPVRRAAARRVGRSGGGGGCRGGNTPAPAIFSDLRARGGRDSTETASYPPLGHMQPSKNIVLISSRACARALRFERARRRGQHQNDCGLPPSSPSSELELRRTVPI